MRREAFSLHRLFPPYLFYVMKNCEIEDSFFLKTIDEYLIKIGVPMTPSFAGPATTYIFLELRQIFLGYCKILIWFKLGLAERHLGIYVYLYSIGKFRYLYLSSIYYLGTYIYFSGKRIINLPQLNNIALNLHIQ